MALKNSHIAVVVIVLLLVQFGYPGGISGAISHFTTPAAVIPAPPSGGNTTPTPGTPYTGPISLAVNTLWAYDESANAISSARVTVYHHDWTYVTNMTIASGVGTAGTIVQSSPDQGVLYIVVRYLTSTTYFVDRDLTVAKNPVGSTSSGITAWTLKDVDNNGQDDLIFTLDVSRLPAIQAGQTTQPVNINIYSWKAMSSGGSLTAISSPTGMTTAGDYHATGYYASWTGEGYQLRLLKAVVAPTNTTSAASSLYDDFAAGTASIKGYTFRGMGTDTLGNSVTMGNAWTAVNYDASQNQYLWYQASWNGKVDVTQVSYGMPIIYYRQAGASWLQFDIWIHVGSGVLVASSIYDITTTLTFTNPAGTTFTEAITTVLTG